MTVSELIDSNEFSIINTGADTQRDISCVFCCDMLSIAMSRAPSGCAWVTVMGNINTLAVASLCDAACIILAEGVCLDPNASQKAVEKGITVLASDRPIFDTALIIHDKLK